MNNFNFSTILLIILINFIVAMTFAKVSQEMGYAVSIQTDEFTDTKYIKHRGIIYTLTPYNKTNKE